MKNSIKAWIGTNKVLIKPAFKTDLAQDRISAFIILIIIEWVNCKFIRFI